jgi:UDP-N-acetylglucosamine/UDP-N-acetylgalactosamine diphosphorylase
VHTYCVDSYLMCIADLIFISYSISKKADSAAKVVPNVHSNESLRGWALSTVSSSTGRFPPPRRSPRATRGRAWRAAIPRKQHCEEDPPCCAPIRSSTPNGIKLETFVFDGFPYTERFAVLEVANEDEFSPLKYTPGTGADDRETRRRDLLKARSGARLPLPPVTCIPAIKKWLALTVTYRRPSGL